MNCIFIFRNAAILRTEDFGPLVQEFQPGIVSNIYAHTGIAFKGGIVLADNDFEWVWCDGLPVKGAESSLGNEGENNVKGFNSIWKIKKQTGTVEIITDYLASRPVFYAKKGNGIALSNISRWVVDQVEPSINQDWLKDYFSKSYSSFENTSFTQIKRVPPYSKLSYNWTEGVKIVPLADDLNLNLSLKDWEWYLEKFKEKLKCSVNQNIEPTSKVCVELSAGLDSSTVLAYLAEGGKPEEILALTHVNDSNSAFYMDEREDVAKLLSYFKNVQGAFMESEGQGIFSDLSEAQEMTGLIPDQFFEFGSLALYRHALSRGFDTVLSGFGGDQGVSGKSSWILNYLLKTGQWKRYWSEIQFLYKGRYGKQVTKLLTPLLFFGFPGLYEWRRKRTIAQNLTVFGSFQFLTNTFIKSTGIREHFMEERLKRHKDPDPSTLLSNKIVHPFVTQRLQNAYQISNYMGFKYHHPLLDKDLVKLYMAIPHEYKMYQGVKRYIIREAIKGKVPEFIYSKTSKAGAANPNVFNRIFNQVNELMVFADFCRKKQLGEDVINFEKVIEKLSEVKAKPASMSSEHGALLHIFNYLLYLAKKENLHERFIR